jgi:hypothetical protein
VLLSGAPFYAIATMPLHIPPYIDSIALTRTENEGVADWIRRNLPRDARIAVHDAGYLAFATDRHLIDIVGLKTPDARLVHQAITAPSGGAARGEALAQIDLTPVRAEGDYQVFRVRRAS